MRSSQCHDVPTSNSFFAIEFLFSIRRVEGFEKLVRVIVCILKFLEVNITLKYKSLTEISTLIVKQCQPQTL